MHLYSSQRSLWAPIFWSKTVCQHPVLWPHWCMKYVVTYWPQRVTSCHVTNLLRHQTLPLPVADCVSRFHVEFWQATLGVYSQHRHLLIWFLLAMPLFTGSWLNFKYTQPRSEPWSLYVHHPGELSASLPFEGNGDKIVGTEKSTEAASS